MPDHLSPSQVNTFMNCPAKWAFRYVDEIKTPPSGALTLGSSFDAACQAQFNSRMKHEKDLSLEDIKGAFEEKFDELAPETDFDSNSRQVLDKEFEISIENGYSDTKDKGIGAVRTYHAHPTGLLAIRPTAVQHKVTLPASETLPEIVGFIDVIHDNAVIVDQKTTGRTPSEAKADHVDQLLMYSMLMEYELGVSLPIRIDYTVTLKAKGKCVQYELPADQEQQSYLIRNYARVAKQIDMIVANPSLIIPRRTDNFLCSEKWCGYWTLCHERY